MCYAVRGCSTTHTRWSDKPSWLNSLGNSVLRRFVRLGDLSDLNKSVLILEDAVQLTPDGHPNLPSRLNDLGGLFSSRFDRLGNLNDINKSVLMFEDAVRLTQDGHPAKPSWLNNLGNSLFRRFEQLGNLIDINKSVLVLEDAVQSTPDGHPDKPSWLLHHLHVVFYTKSIMMMLGMPVPNILLLLDQFQALPFHGSKHAHDGRY